MNRYSRVDDADLHAVTRDRVALRDVGMGDLQLWGNTRSGRRAGTIARWGHSAHHRSARVRSATRSLRLARTLAGRA